MDLRTLAQDFVVYLEAERGYSPLTARAYRSDLRQFIDFLATKQHPAEPSGITTPLVREWIVEMKHRDLSARSIARAIYALRSFWQYLLDIDVVTHDPLRRVSAPKCPQRLPNRLSAEELRWILAASQRQRLAFCAFRDHAIMAVLVFTGMRRGELVSLRVGDVDLSSGSARIQNGKGGKARVVPLVGDAIRVLEDQHRRQRPDSLPASGVHAGTIPKSGTRTS